MAYCHQCLEYWTMIVQWFSTGEWNMAPALLTLPCSLFCWDPDTGSFSTIVVDADWYLIPTNRPQSFRWIFIALTVLKNRRWIWMACKFRYGYRIKLASQALNGYLAPSWCSKVALALNSCNQYHLLYNRTNTFLLQRRFFFIPHVGSGGIEGKSYQFLLVGDLWIILILGSFSPPSRRNILLQYFRLFAGVSNSPFLVFVDLSPKGKCEAFSTKSPSLQSRCSFMARIPSIRMLFHHTCLAVAGAILNQLLHLTRVSQPVPRRADRRHLGGFPSQQTWAVSVLKRVSSSGLHLLQCRSAHPQTPVFPKKLISSQPIPVSSECSRFVFFTFFSLSRISNF